MAFESDPISAAVQLRDVKTKYKSLTVSKPPYSCTYCKKLRYINVQLIKKSTIHL